MRHEMRNPYTPPRGAVTDPESAFAQRLARIFQHLVGASVALIISAIAIAFLPSPVSKELTESVEAAYPALLADPEYQAFLALLLLSIWLIALIGLYFFKSWARWLFVSFNVAALLFTLVI